MAKNKIKINKNFSLVLIALGAGLIIWGSNVSHSFSSGVSKLITGSPSDKAMWLFISGGVAVILGLYGFFRKK